MNTNMKNCLTYIIWRDMDMHKSTQQLHLPSIYRIQFICEVFFFVKMIVECTSLFFHTATFRGSHIIIVTIWPKYKLLGQVMFSN